MNTADKAPQQFLDYIKKHGTKVNKTWTLEWSDDINNGKATVTEVDPGIYNMTGEVNGGALPKTRMEQGVFKRLVTDDDVTAYWVVNPGSVTAVSMFNYFNTMRHAVAATKPC